MKRKLLSLVIAVSLLFTNTGVFAPQSAQAFFHEKWELPKIELPKLEWPKIEWPKIELPRFEIPTFTIPGTDIVLDATKGFNFVEQIKDQLPDEIDIPGTSFKIYPKEPVGVNVVRNIAPFLSGAMEFLDPLKPVASIARTIIKTARPFIEPLIKKIMPTGIKSGAYWAKEQIKNIIKAVDQPLIKDIVLPVWDFLVGPIDDLAMEIIDIFAEEEKQGGGGTGGGGGGSGGDLQGHPPEVIIPEPFKNQLPLGYFNQIDANGIATGWAVDPNNPSASIRVRMHPILGQYPNEIEANLPSPGLQYPGNHGFSYRIPSGMRNGKENLLEAYGKDNDEWGVEGKLSGTHKYTLFEPAFGEINWISPEGIISGWAVDPDSTPPAEVKLYIDEKTYLGSAMANQSSSYLSDEKLAKARGASKNLGFNFALDRSKYYDGLWHKISAYVVNKKDTGETREILLENSPYKFMYPATLPIKFALDTVIVQQGSRVFQTILEVPNQQHTAIVSLDGHKIDINIDRHSYPTYESSNDLIIKSDGTSAKSRSVLFDFKTAKNLSLGFHTVTVEAPSTNYLNFNYQGSFKINVVPYDSIVGTVPDILTSGAEFELELKNIPKGIKLTGKDANASVFSMSFEGDRDLSSGWGLPLSTVEKGDGTVTVRVQIPSEMSHIIKGTGPVRASVRLDLKNALAKEEMRVDPLFSFFYFPAKTAEGKDPLFKSICTSSGQVAMELNGGAGAASGKGSGFGCYSKLTVTAEGSKAAQPFSLTLPHPALSFIPAETEWNGDVSYFRFDTNGLFTRDYLGVEDLKITIKDDEGHEFTKIVKITSPYQVRVMPLRGNIGDLLQSGDDLRIAWKGFTGNFLNISIDGTPFRKIDLSGLGSLKTLPADPGMVYYDGYYLPNWVGPGEHRLLMEDISQLDEKKRVVYQAETVFKVAGEEPPVKEEIQKLPPPTDIPKKDVSKKNAPPVTPEKPVVPPKPKPAPKVTVSPNPATAGQSVTLSMSGFGPLGTVSIYLKGNGKQIKLSGFADYTDSDGALTKTTRLPEDLVGGRYTITASDTALATDSTSLNIEAIELPPPPPKPTPQPTPNSDRLLPEPDPVDLPDENNSIPTCPAGSTYSPTFKQCIEDTPQRSPYDGLPCPPEGTVPSYATQGCIP